MKVFIPLIVLIGVVSASFDVCHLNSGLPTGQFPAQFRVSGCTQGAARCNIRRNSNMLAEVEFITSSRVTSLRPQVTAHALNQVVHYDLPAETLIGCDHLVDARCPLDEGLYVEYHFSFFVGDEYPLIDLNIELRTFDQDNVMQFCADVVATVVA